MALHKSWCWAGAFGPDMMLCVAAARVGPLRRSWWAVWDGALREGTRGVSVSASGAVVPGALALTFERGRSVEVTTGPAWTRKTPLRVTGTVGARTIDLPGLLDESAGRHARRTAWRWAAGAGTAASGAAVVWNLVAGLHDGAVSERTVWVDGEPHPVGPLPFHGLDGVGELAFTAVATRAKRENYLVLASDYEQPFGAFSGSLPVAGAVRGHGVMERHEALW
ncbi:MAG TPA: DUF2804 family protein [Solirubrobacter sp.]|nr:DUF2804 family protein [Solirubrobacter sp.]